VSAHPFLERIRSADLIQRSGRVRKIMATHIEADGPNLALGGLCDVEACPGMGRRSFRAEVVRVDPDKILLSPLDDNIATYSGARVVGLAQTSAVPVGPMFLGRAVDSLGVPIDGCGDIRATHFLPLQGETVSPLDRASPDETLETGLRAVDGLLTLGKGQRVGIFAASGVGKTSLVTQLADHVSADITILCLVGERGREVEAMWNKLLDAGTRARTTLVAATSDQSAARRVRAAQYALALAEYWRSQGKHVLLLLDSITRLAMALREIGLAAGEPPTIRAYTPSAFAAIPKLMERCGALKAGGAITAIVTVLSETDEIDDPISELMKSVLDGHIVLSRTFAERGQFPAIDVGRSVSRQAQELARGPHRDHALQLLEWIGLHQSSQTLINAGLYMKGANAKLDQALERQPEILNFLRQRRDERSPLSLTTSAMVRLVGGGTHRA